MVKIKPEVGIGYIFKQQYIYFSASHLLHKASIFYLEQVFLKHGFSLNHITDKCLVDQSNSL